MVSMEIYLGIFQVKVCLFLYNRLPNTETISWCLQNEQSQDLVALTNERLLFLTVLWVGYVVLLAWTSSLTSQDAAVKARLVQACLHGGGKGKAQCTRSFKPLLMSCLPSVLLAKTSHTKPRFSGLKK